MAGESYLGGEAKFYYNSATQASPTWVLIDNCQDLDMPDSRTAVAVQTRGNWPYVKNLSGARTTSITWSSIQKQETTDTVLTALIAAYDAGTVIEFAIADQANATVGCKYRRVITQIVKCDQSEPLDGVVTISFEAVPTINDGGVNPSRNTAS